MSDAVPNRPRLPALTSLRFFAALHVMLFHLYSMKIVTGSGLYRNFAAIGYVGVSLFFVLSGFILVYTYAGREMSVWRFWQARFARIYPAYLFSLVLTAPFFFYVCIALKNQDIPFYAWFKYHVGLCATLVPVLLQSWVPNAALAWNAPAWSLSVEAFFYLLFPVILYRMLRFRSRTLAWIVPACWALSLAFGIAYVVSKPDGLPQVDDNTFNQFWLNGLKFSPLVRLPEFLMGAACGVLFIRGTLDRKWASALVFTAISGGLMVVVFSSKIPYPMLHDSVLPPAFAVLIYGMALRPRWLTFLEFKPLVLLGEASYSFYLLHSTALGMYFFGSDGKLRPVSKLGLAIGMLIPVVASLFVYFLIEQPGRRWLRPKAKAEPEAAAMAVAEA